MTASVTFGNINGHMEPAPYLSLHMEQRRAEPVSVTTPTVPVQTRQGIKHRGSSSNDDVSHDTSHDTEREAEREECRREGETETFSSLDGLR